MTVLVTGSSGHLGEALMRTLPDAVGLDARPGAFTRYVGSIGDRAFVRDCVAGVDAVLHTATLHKPHVATHSAQAFVDTNVTGTLALLEAAVAARVRAFVFTSTTSTFGRALAPPPGAPAAWITEDVVPVAKNIYGVTKVAAESLCELFSSLHHLPCVVLRTSRFFPEADDDAGARAAFDDANLKVNELLNRRGDVEDMVSAHVAALAAAPRVGFGRFIVSATTPFARADAAELRVDAPAVICRLVPECTAIYAARGWQLPPTLDRVYDNSLARRVLGWEPRHDFRSTLRRLAAGEDVRSPLARAIGAKGYHG